MSRSVTNVGIGMRVKDLETTGKEMNVMSVRTGKLRVRVSVRLTNGGYVVVVVVVVGAGSVVVVVVVVVMVGASVVVVVVVVRGGYVPGGRLQGISLVQTGKVMDPPESLIPL